MLAQYENGAECYDNLRDTVFSTDYPIQKFLQSLLNDRFATLVFQVKDAQLMMRQCACSMIQINDMLRGEHFKPENVEFRLESTTTSTPATLSNDTQGTTADQTRRPIQVPVCTGSEPLQLTVRLLHATEQQIGSLKRSDCKYYAGFQVWYNGQVLTQVQWQRHKLLLVNLNASVELESYQTIGFPANDTKQGLLLCGVCSASSSCPCLVCCARSTTFTSNLPL